MQEKATFGAGCFWGVEATFRKTDGTDGTQVGYCGGHTGDPSYKNVCTGKTGHAEVVEVTFDPEIISYEQLLHIFWDCHNPTHKNRQGPDIGSQYRSVIFYHTDEQKKYAEKVKEKFEQSNKYSEPIVTEIEPIKPFYKAEDYHQQYIEKRGLSNCHSN